jgi:3-hydroxybutyryl-CoA dehydrogenase
MDLIGHDTNFAVTNSVYEANFYDKRYVPSLVQREMVDAGLLGRKSGRGFYRYPDGVPALPVPVIAAPHTARELTVHGRGAIADAIEQAVAKALADQGWGPAREASSDWTGLSVDGMRLVLTDGRPAFEIAAHAGQPDIAVFDRPVAQAGGGALAYAMNAGAGGAWQAEAPAWLHALGHTPLRVADTPGLVVARTLAMLINEAADAVLQGVCNADGADAAMKLGVNYPAGPFEWLRDWGIEGVGDVVGALDAAYRGERYRLSPWLRRGGG